MRPTAIVRAAWVLVFAALPLSGCKAKESAATGAAKSARSELAKSWRFEQGGWIFVHLQGSPTDVGFQHGSLLAPEIADAFETVKLTATHSTKKPWEFFREASHSMLWPKMDAEYQAEIRGIVERELKRIGFGSVTIDPKGFRSGSLNEGIVSPAMGRE